MISNWIEFTLQDTHETVLLRPEEIVAVAAENGHCRFYLSSGASLLVESDLLEVEQVMTRQKEPPMHIVNMANIDSTDEIDDSNQLVYVWCGTHQKYEWHNLPLEWQGRLDDVVVRRDPLWEK